MTSLLNPMPEEVVLIPFPFQSSIPKATTPKSKHGIDFNPHTLHHRFPVSVPAPAPRPLPRIRIRTRICSYLFPTSSPPHPPIHHINHLQQTPLESQSAKETHPSVMPEEAQNSTICEPVTPLAPQTGDAGLNAIRKER